MVNQDTVRKGDWVRVTSVDPYGYTGREYHPIKERDEGVCAQVVRIEIWHGPDEIDGTDLEGYCCLTCVSHEPAPRFLDLMDFEVEPVQPPTHSV